MSIPRPNNAQAAAETAATPSPSPDSEMLQLAQGLESAVEQRDLEIAKLRLQLSSIQDVQVFAKHDEPLDDDAGSSPTGTRELAEKLDSSFAQTNSTLGQALDVLSRTASERTQQLLVNGISSLDRRTEKLLQGDLPVFQATSERIDQIAAAIVGGDFEGERHSATDKQLAEILSTIRELDSRLQETRSADGPNEIADEPGSERQDVSQYQHEISDALQELRVICQEQVLSETSSASRQLAGLAESQQRTEETLASLQQMLAGICTDPDPRNQSVDASLEATVIGDPMCDMTEDVAETWDAIRSRFGMAAESEDRPDEDIELTCVGEDLESPEEADAPPSDTVMNQLADAMFFEVESTEPKVPWTEIVPPEVIEDFSEMTSEAFIEAIHERDDFIIALIHRLREAQQLNVDKLVRASAKSDAAENGETEDHTPAHILESQQRINDILRMAEIEVSMERAKLSRQRKNLLDIRQQLQKRAIQMNCTVTDDDELVFSQSGMAGSGKRRWLSKLGIGKDGTQ